MFLFCFFFFPGGLSKWTGLDRFKGLDLVLGDLPHQNSINKCGFDFDFPLKPPTKWCPQKTSPPHPGLDKIWSVQNLKGTQGPSYLFCGTYI